MKNLYIFGDSFSTNFSTINEVDESESWPTLLSNKLGYELKNFASPGISNYGILNKVYSNLDIKKIDYSDLVIIGFTFYDRIYDFYKDRGIDLRNNKVDGYDEYEIDFYSKKIINENEMLQYTNTALLQYNFIIDSLRSKGISFLFWNMDKCGLPLFNKMMEKYPKNYINPFGKMCWIDYCNSDSKWWQTNGDRHFGKYGHLQFFQYLYQYIQRINYEI
jgi:hypothetical protein